MNRFTPDQATIRIHDDGWRLHLRWSANDRDVWQQLLQDFKATFPHWTRRAYHSETRTWSVPLSQHHRVQTWADAWFTRDGQQWDAGETDAGSTNGDTFGRGTGGRATAQASPLDCAYATLHLLPTAPPELVTAAYRIAAQHHHPDRGGTTTAMATINDAVQTIRQHHDRIAS